MEKSRDKFNEILKDFKDYEILSYFFDDSCSIKTIYMYPRDESKYEKLYPNYILLVKNDIHYKCIGGSIYLYKDNDGRGVYDFGLCNVNLFENEFHNIDDACNFYFAKFPHHYCFIEINIKPLIYDIDNPVFICDKYKYKIKQKLINLFKSFINIK